MSDLEWIVEVNQEDKFIGKIERGLAHASARLRWHREVMTLLFTDKSHSNFLLQHRSPKKKQLPGYWTLSATGHVDYSDLNTTDVEGYLTAAKRESMEEIGVIANNLTLEGKVLQQIPQNWSVMGLVTGEFEGELKLDPDEVDEVRVFNRKSIVEIGDKLTPGARACLIFLKFI